MIIILFIVRIIIIIVICIDCAGKMAFNYFVAAAVENQNGN